MPRQPDFTARKGILKKQSAGRHFWSEHVKILDSFPDDVAEYVKRAIIGMNTTASNYSRAKKMSLVRRDAIHEQLKLLVELIDVVGKDPCDARRTGYAWAPGMNRGSWGSWATSL